MRRRRDFRMAKARLRDAWPVDDWEWQSWTDRLSPSAKRLFREIARLTAQRNALSQEDRGEGLGRWKARSPACRALDREITAVSARFTIAYDNTV